MARPLGIRCGVTGSADISERNFTPRRSNAYSLPFRLRANSSAEPPAETVGLLEQACSNDAAKIAPCAFRPSRKRLSQTDIPFIHLP